MKAIVGFIDLLATKESSRVSQVTTDSAIKTFLSCLVLNKVLLGDTKCEIRCLSDSAFFQLPASEVAALFLQRLRKDLFDRRLYFKCGLVAGELETSVLDADFLEEFIKKENIREKLGGKTTDEIAIALSEDVQGFYFSRRAVEAYELQESFKGIGYSLSRSASESLNDFTIGSLYFVDDRLEKPYSYTDITFNNNFELGEGAPKEVLQGQNIPDLTKDGASEENEFAVGLTYINSLLRSLQIASIKKKAYTKYYLPTLISMIRSCSFSDMHIEQNNIVGAPIIYKRFVLDNALGRMKTRPKGGNKVLACLLDASLEQLEHQDNEETEVEQVKNFVCAQFSTIPGFVNSIHETNENFLSAKNREFFLDSVVR